METRGSVNQEGVGLQAGPEVSSSASDELSPGRGFLAVSAVSAVTRIPDVAQALAAAGVVGGRREGSAPLQLVSWGSGLGSLSMTEPLLLSLDPRRGDRSLTSVEVLRMLRTGDRRTLGQVLPTFAAVGLRDERTLVAATDALGFRHLYLAQAPGWAAISTSPRVLAGLTGSAIDREAVAVQSLLGWQLGQRTLFEGVTKVPPGGLMTLSGGRATTEVDDLNSSPGLSLDEAVEAAADVLRQNLTAYLDDHADVGLQLTGGQDSRILLSAIAPSRRAEVRAVTLVVPGSPDAPIAARLAELSGMEHEILSLAGVDALSPSDAYRRCVNAARALELGADPLARAALSIAESRSLPGARLSGLGGEVARGFYYLGRSVDAPVTWARTRRLVTWRMFANEAVSKESFVPDFARWASDLATRDVHRLLLATGRPWLAATDELYLGQRMQRWAGVTETAGCLDRPVTNPMLDARFIAVARRLSPEDKRNSRFLGRLQVALDPALGALPLDGRPPPATYASPGWASSARRGVSLAGKAERKLRQRLRGETRPPAGGDVLAAKVLEHWRRHPGLLEPLGSLGIFRQDWINAVVAARAEVSPAGVALLLNLSQAHAVIEG